ncbi:tRNA (guanine(10)-N2)-methyltransferase homolog [Limulus polyphemus]|uniref:tRNA (guanine(10)-N(2))-methyltransferase TRMT11 n=1 Tax=Limulus polyphemus TaxID=6850 RepID=A0ABM1BJ76_LIMPO|nr:tRNA (guanine(10)-N2)-methyltransferase homolog [Limulus polyphemus]
MTTLGVTSMTSLISQASSVGDSTVDLSDFVCQEIEYYLSHRLSPDIARAFSDSAAIIQDDDDFDNFFPPPEFAIPSQFQPEARVGPPQLSQILSAFKLWGQGATHEDLHTQLKQISLGYIEPFCHPDKSFKVEVETFGKKISRNDKVNRIEDLDFLPLRGPIKLKDPDNIFHLIEYYGLDPNSVPDNPYQVFFGQWICDGQRHLITQIALKDRKFIGNTSMDPKLSLIMANMAKICHGDLVLDPFVGSGSLLVAAATFGGYVCGTDLDFLMVHGKAKPTRCNQKKREPDENIRSNLRQYGLESHYLDVIVADAALPVWSDQCMFSAIIADPPYGIREATERIGTAKTYTIPDHLVSGHIPSKVSYNLQDIIRDLLNFSGAHLQVGGRLVYWLPVFKNDFQADLVPAHPSLQLISLSEQSLNSHSSRYLVTMERLPENSKGCKENQNGAHVPEATRVFRDKYFQKAVERRLQTSYPDSGHTHIDQLS